MSGKKSVKLNFIVDIVIEPDGDMFHAFAPALKGLHVEGENEKQALRYAAEAAESYIEALISRGEPIPLPVTEVSIPEAPDSEHEGVHKHRQGFALALT